MSCISEVLINIELSKRIFFFAKFLVKQLPAFHHPYLTGISSSFQYFTNTLPFQNFLFENIDTMLATWPFNRPYPRTRLSQNSFTL